MDFVKCYCPLVGWSFVVLGFDNEPSFKLCSVNFDVHVLLLQILNEAVKNNFVRDI